MQLSSSHVVLFRKIPVRQCVLFKVLLLYLNRNTELALSVDSMMCTKRNYILMIELNK